MKMFSLDWFKSEKRKKLDELEIEKKTIQNEILKQHLVKKEPIESEPPSDSSESLIKKIMLIDTNLTVVLSDGNILSKTNATKEDFINVKYATSLTSILDIFKEYRKDEKEENQIDEREIREGAEVLSTLDRFIIKDNSLYFKNIDRSIPPLLTKHLGEIAIRFKNSGEDDWKTMLYEDDEFNGLSRFFMWACLNPRAEVAKELYDFLHRNSFRITKQGFFVALRNVVSLLPEEDEKVRFISNAYNKIKGVWKKKPKDYEVVEQLGEYRLEKTKSSSDDYAGTWIGNLEELYVNLPDMKENRFTDDWTRTFDIRIGKVVNMPPEKCNWSTQDCAAAGLHFTSDEIHYVGCGDTSVLVLINPMKIVGIGTHKGRCYEYLPIMTVPREEATEILHDIDFDTLELDESYAIHELDNIDDYIQGGFVAELNKDKFNLPSISSTEVKDIVSMLNDMRREIESRIVPII